MENINQFIVVATVLFSICVAVHFWLLWARTRAELNSMDREFAATLIDRNHLKAQVKNMEACITKLSADREEMIKHLQMFLTKADATDEEKIAELKKWHAHLSYKKVGSAISFTPQGVGPSHQTYNSQWPGVY